MITDIRLQHFRSYSDESFELSPSVNIIVGPNASGKTNLLEALLVLARGTSYRAKDLELIQFDKDWARLDADSSSGDKRTVKLTQIPAAKSYEFDGKKYSRLTHEHSLPVVLFEPNHLLLLAGPPEGRRAYLDELLEQTLPGYTRTRQQYRRALAQRNAMLKKGLGNRIDLFPWDVRISELGAIIARARNSLSSRLNDRIGELYKALSKTDTAVELTYGAQFPIDDYETRLLNKLETSYELDVRRGFTGNGPHREDLIVSFDGHLAEDAASRGETRTATLALKIMELSLLEEARGKTPLLLLDDVFSELDGARRRALTSYLQPYQTFITTTDADVVVQHFTESAHIVPLNK